jgi:hypothetical protein
MVGYFDKYMENPYDERDSVPIQEIILRIFFRCQEHFDPSWVFAFARTLIDEDLNLTCDLLELIWKADPRYLTLAISTTDIESEKRSLWERLLSSNFKAHRAPSVQFLELLTVFASTSHERGCYEMLILLCRTLPCVSLLFFIDHAGRECQYRIARICNFLMMTDNPETVTDRNFTVMFHEAGLLAKLSVLIPDLPYEEWLQTMNLLASKMPLFNDDMMKSVVNPDFLDNLTKETFHGAGSLRLRVIAPILRWIVDSQLPEPALVMYAGQIVLFNLLPWGDEAYDAGPDDTEATERANDGQEIDMSELCQNWDIIRGRLIDVLERDLNSVDREERARILTDPVREARELLVGDGEFLMGERRESELVAVAAAQADVIGEAKAVEEEDISAVAELWAPRLLVDDSGQVREIDDLTVPQSPEMMVEDPEVGVPERVNLEEEEEAHEAIEEWDDDTHAEIERLARKAACDVRIHAEIERFAREAACGDESGHVTVNDEAEVPGSIDLEEDEAKECLTCPVGRDEAAWLIEVSQASVPGSVDLEEEEEEQKEEEEEAHEAIQEWDDKIHAEIERRAREAACRLGIDGILNFGASLGKACSTSD